MTPAPGLLKTLLANDICWCHRAKVRSHYLCPKCWRSLTPELRARLRDDKGDAELFAAAYDDAREYLRRTVHVRMVKPVQQAMTGAADYPD